MSADSEVEPADGGAINIGEPMDLDDPSTWPQYGRLVNLSPGGLSPKWWPF
ncbi:hypothetical protein N9U42_03740 [Luminiphilus sp.]|nr:hypothetical protein [Luminiphilus sp.]